MTGVVDRAHREQMFQEEMALARRKHVPGIKPNGTCHYCLEKIEHPKLFCDGDCASDFEVEERQRRFRS